MWEMLLLWLPSPCGSFFLGKPGGIFFLGETGGTILGRGGGGCLRKTDSTILVKSIDKNWWYYS